jgi:hypothetical protein
VQFRGCLSISVSQNAALAGHVSRWSLCKDAYIEAPYARAWYVVCHISVCRVSVGPKWNARTVPVFHARSVSWNARTVPVFHGVSGGG